MAIRIGRLIGLALLCWLLPAAGVRAEEQAAMGARLAADETVAFDVYLPLRQRAQLDRLLDDLHRPDSPDYHRWLTPAAFARRFGASPDTLAAAARALQARGLDVSVNGNHSLHAAGRAAAVERIIGTTLAAGRFPRTGGRPVAAGPRTLVPDLAALGAVIPHFARTIHMRRHSMVAEAAQPDSRAGTLGNYWFDDLKQAYSFPAIQVANGAGSTIGVLMSGGFLASDMTSYFSHELIATPTMTTVAVSGGAPFSTTGDSGETELDLQQAGGMAPGARLILYNVPDLSDASLLAGLRTIVESNAADIVNMSFGEAELGYTAAYNNGVSHTDLLQTYDELFAEGVAQGITFVASSGDAGALPIPQTSCITTSATKGCGVFVRSAQFPASSPHVTAVGGTNLVTQWIAGTFASGYVSEAAFDDKLAKDIFYGSSAIGGVWGSGGGLSTMFAQPSFQKGISSISKQWRMVPDVAMHMGGCPGGAVAPCGANRSADVEVFNGAITAVIGTSAAAPDFAGLLALRRQLTHGRLGNENYHLYAAAVAQASGAKPQVFRTTIPGNNGYATVPGYNLVLGNGTVFANAYLGVANLPAAGIPRSPSNP